MRFNNKSCIGDRCWLSQCGFTLVELMITVALLAIVLSLGVPSFRQMIVDNRMTSHANLLVTSLNVARSEAINRSDSVTVTATSGTNWHLGWSAATSSGTTLRSQSAFKGGATLVGTAGNLTFSSTGYLSGAAVTFDLCDAEATTERRITVVPGGRVNLDTSHVCP
ncbi:GspH/FimT family pseudopilin [Sedimenticola hydrogenitrophicus]|uniref:GspH/FimT family pseudopilin n=1 Tax=Sedimenticola hydrogenitrophicus TaxID=2967975 RepID=UPI003AAA9B4E